MPRVGEPIEGDGLMVGDGLAIRVGSSDTRVGVGIGDSFWQADIDMDKSSSQGHKTSLFLNQITKFWVMLLTSKMMILFYVRLENSGNFIFHG